MAGITILFRRLRGRPPVPADVELEAGDVVGPCAGEAAGGTAGASLRTGAICRGEAPPAAGRRRARANPELLIMRREREPSRHSGPPA
jgi:hypothetical protein